MVAYLWRSLSFVFFVFVSYSLVFKASKSNEDQEVQNRRQKRSPVDEMVQSEVGGWEPQDLFLDQFLKPNRWRRWTFDVENKMDGARADPNIGTAFRPLHKRLPRSVEQGSNNLTLLVKQMREYVEDNMINKDPMFDEKFTAMLETALWNSTEAGASQREQREMAKTLLQAWRVHLKEETVAATTSRPRIVREECKQPASILANDTLETVREKQGHRMQCYINPEADPCEDFYEYACGNWPQYFPIPKDRGGFDTFELLREDLDAKLRHLLQSPVTEADTNSSAAVKVLYSSCMNTGRIEERGEEPLLALLEDLGGWPVLEGGEWNEDGFDWVEMVGKLRLYNNDILISLWVGPDGKNSDHYIVQFDQSDLVLPSAEYYHQGISHPIMRAYQSILTNVATLLGADPELAARDMEDVIAFEIKLATIMTPPHERRNFSQIYEKLPLSELSAKVTDFNFTQYLDIVLPKPLPPTDEVVIYAAKYLIKLAEIIAETPPRVLSNYILMRFIRHRINNLDTRFEKVQNELYRLLYGREEMPARWKFCIAYVNGNLGMSVGSLFVREFFDGQSKQDMLYLTAEIQAPLMRMITMPY